MNVFSLDDLKDGRLVSEITQTKAEFVYKGQKASVDIMVKPLPFAQTDKFLSAIQRGEDVLPEWIAAALVDENGKPKFTVSDVREKFNQTLVNAIYAKLMGELSLQTETIDSGEFDEDGEDLGKKEP